jgi:hypothetical protein
MAGIHKGLSDQKLGELGFERCTPDPGSGDSPYFQILDQWAYKDIVLVRRADPTGAGFGVRDKMDGHSFMGINNMDELKSLIRLVDRGGTIAGLFWETQRRRGIVASRRELPYDQRPSIEDFRNNEIGKSFLQSKVEVNVKVYSTYDQHSRAAFDYTLADVLLIESSVDILHPGNNTYSTIGLWYMALESYITTLLKLCCLKKGEDFNKKYRNQDLHIRLGSLLELLQIDKKEVFKTGIVNKILEFSQFRNELMHDRHFDKEMSFNRCRFSGIPIFANQVDVLQSFLIVLETTALLRYVIAGLDTMPTVVIQGQDRFAWEKLDVAYMEILLPFFRYALEKHGLKTGLDLNFLPPEGITSSLFVKGEIEPLLGVNIDPKLEIVLCDSQTNQLSQLINSYFTSRNHAENTFRVARNTISDE